MRLLHRDALAKGQLHCYRALLYCGRLGPHPPGEDALPTSGTLTFSPGDIFKTFTVPTQLDAGAAGDLNFTLVLGATTIIGGSPLTVNVQNPGTATMRKSRQH